MPFFDYMCDHCGHREERMVKSSDDKVICSNCGEETNKQVSAPKGIKFKGSGFYETDYKGKQRNDHLDNTGMVSMNDAKGSVRWGSQND